MSAHYDAEAVVVGAGMAGLAAAHRLASRGLKTIVLEKEPRPGGRASSVMLDGLPVEMGAAFVSEFYAATRNLVADVGLASSLVERSQTAYVVRGGQARELWPVKQLLAGQGLTRLAKFRLLGLLPPLLAHWQSLDIADLPRSASFDHETAAQFSRRWLGRQATDYFFEPLLRGLLYWDSDTTSAAMVLCILKAFGTSKGTYRFAGGMQQFADALAAGLDVRAGAPVTSVERVGGNQFKVVLAGGAGHDLTCRGVIFATPAPAVAQIAPWLPAPERSFLESVTYSRTTLLTYSVPTAAAGYPRGAVLFPSSSVPDLSSLNPLYQYVDGFVDNQPDNPRLLNVYLSNRGALESENVPDDLLGKSVLRRLSDLLGSPEWIASAEMRNVKRWELAIPRFTVGHIARIGEFESAVTDEPRLAFAGDYLMGPYIDGAIRSGQAAADRIARQLGRES